jgi:glycerol-3-phosphate acyltransferase PlsY
MLSIPIIVALAYLLGSIPFGFLLVRAFRGADIRQSGSGNIGATNVARTSPALGIATLFLDALKGVAAVFLAVVLTRAGLRSLHPGLNWHLGQPWSTAPTLVYWHAVVAAVFAVVGHVFPVWLKFKGGKGVATGLGSFVLLAPKAVLIMIGIFIAIVLIFRYVSLGSILAFACFPLLAWFFREYELPNALLLFGATSVLIIWKHRDNIVRLLNGTENRLSLRRR